MTTHIPPTFFSPLPHFWCSAIHFVQITALTKASQLNCFSGSKGWIVRGAIFYPAVVEWQKPLASKLWLLILSVCHFMSLLRHLFQHHLPLHTAPCMQVGSYRKAKARWRLVPNLSKHQKIMHGTFNYGYKHSQCLQNSAWEVLLQKFGVNKTTSWIPSQKLPTHLLCTNHTRGGFSCDQIFPFHHLFWHYCLHHWKTWRDPQEECSIGWECSRRSEQWRQSLKATSKLRNWSYVQILYVPSAIIAAKSSASSAQQHRMTGTVSSAKLHPFYLNERQKGKSKKRYSSSSFHYYLSSSR